ncbi:DM13 domain-containing protein [Emticicia sp. BO119]|uniref:DM13 domain-containing protein n=1 Tax=Emticicia sp. BO119 TaxID=2757768 RepID=UPI0015F0DCE0|nr:DM13 domain-containing protein [Emticicia sp. BO119]MBA4849263.1 DM13 domain-containing protein [Emticicia sp. BO119]
MRKKSFVLSVVLLFSLACQKENITTSTDNESLLPNPITQKPENLIAKGTFQSAVHTTSGEVKVYRDINLKKVLLFENFKTDSGPDLRIYMAEDKVLTNFIEITDKVNINGTYSLAIPDEADPLKQKYVLIWCKRFAVLFGSAELKSN